MIEGFLLGLYTALSVKNMLMVIGGCIIVKSGILRYMHVAVIAIQCAARRGCVTMKCRLSYENASLNVSIYSSMDHESFVCNLCVIRSL